MIFINTFIFKSILKKNINFLFHFTQAENLKNIMLNGLLPRSVMDKYGVNYLYNDENRYDNCKNAVCT